MNADQQHQISSGGPSDEHAHAAALQRHAGGTPADLRVGTAVALSSVAKYWVLTNLFPGPIPQVSVYGLHPPRPCDASKPQESGSQPQPCLVGPPPAINMAAALVPQHPHAQIPVSVPGGNGITMGPQQHLEVTVPGQAPDPADKDKLDKGTCTVDRCPDNQVQCDLQMVNAVHSQQQQQANEQMAAQQQSLVQQMSQQHHQQQQHMQHQHLQHQQQQQQQQQQQMGQQQGQGTDSTELQQQQPSSQEVGTQMDMSPDQVKDEKQSAANGCKDMRLPMPGFPMSEMKGHMMDIRTPDGSIVKISAPGAGDQELSKTLGVEMVQSMYKVNVEDINQLLAYHEVFGKLQNEMVAANGGAGAGQTAAATGNAPPIPGKSCAEPGAAGSSISTPTSLPSSVISTPGTHICDICGKIYPYRYQLIVHRRYHTERKPFTCQNLLKQYSGTQKMAERELHYVQV